MKRLEATVNVSREREKAAVVAPKGERDRYPIGVWRHLADDAYNGGNERNPV